MNSEDYCKNENDLILVTGASGYVASHIVKILLELGYRVKGTVRNLKDDKKVNPLRNLVKNPKFELQLCEADLLNENSWFEAVKDCTYVMHTASPFPNKLPKNENELIEPAVNGTLNVLKACAQTNSKIKRVILTSSIAAIAHENYEDGRTYTENDWPDHSTLSPYPKSKTLAEKAAWDFVKEQNEKNQKTFELATINPGFIIGPLLHDVQCTSVEPIKKMMLRKMPLIPDVYIPCCDVRDVALAHVRAMNKPEAVGMRHVIVSTKTSIAFQEWANILSAEFYPKNYSIPTRMAPNFLIKFASLFDDTVKSAVQLLGKKTFFDNSRMLNILKVEPTVIDMTLIDMAYSLIEKKMIPKYF